MSAQDSRKDWDDFELEIAGATNTGPVRCPDLITPLHKLLERGKWTNLSDDEFELLLPCLRLASNLIAAGTDYLAQFLPSNPIHRALGKKKDSVPRQLNQYNFRTEPFSDAELAVTRGLLDEIGEDIEWRLNYTLGKNNGALGMTRHVSDGYYAQEPWPDLNKDIIEESDQGWQCIGRLRRPVLVGIMSEYMDALKRYPPDSEQGLRTMFHAAITITHEIGHVVWVQDFKDIQYSEFGAEPYIENYISPELGFCFEAFLFSGFHVRTAKARADIPLDFESAAVWNPILTTDITMKNRPLYRTQFSIAIEYMQRVFMQKFWDGLGNQLAHDFSTKAVAALKPLTDLNAKIPPATARVPNWTLRRDDGIPIWRNQFTDRGERLSLVGRISPAEIELVKDELRPFYKRDGSLQNPFGEDDDEDIHDPFLNHAMDLETVDISLLEQRVIDDGVVTADYDSSDPMVRLSDALTRVEVRYRPGPPQETETEITATSKLRRHHDHAGHGTRSKRQKLAEAPGKDHDKADRLGDEDYDATDIDALLYHRRPEAYEVLTHKAALKYCVDRKIKPAQMWPEESFQRAKLSVHNREDRILIERMRCYAFSKAEKTFANDPMAIFKIKQARLGSLEHWGLEDVQEFCHKYRIPVRRDMVKQTLGQELKNVKPLLKDESLPEVPCDELEHWTTEDFDSFFRSNNLPNWGDVAIRTLRVHRFVEENDNGNPPNRRLINKDDRGYVQRADDDGVEVYGFDIALARTSVGALKGHLFRIVMVAADQDISLYIGCDRRSPLENGKPLGWYGLKRNWLDVQMTVQPLKVTVDTTEKEPAPAPLPPPVYVPKNLKPAGRIFNSTTTTTTINSPKLPKPTLDPSLKRLYDIRHSNTLPTFHERMQFLSRRAVELDKAITSGGGTDPLRPHLKSVIANSPAEILDNLEDVEEVRQSREKAIDSYVENWGKENLEVQNGVMGGVGGNWGEGDGEGNGVPRDAPGHMKEMFRRVKGRGFE